jgi:WD40 repeat protein
MWDVFISHAAEDKEDIARPLAEALVTAGLRVWYDDFTLKLGDSLGRSIDRGLSETRYGIVILSPAFFAKEWPRRELDGLTAREVSAGKLILPVWHHVSRAEVERFSPILADKLSVSTVRGLDYVVGEILHVLKDEPVRKIPSPKPRRLSWKLLTIMATFLMVIVAGAQGYHYYQTKQWERARSLAVSGKWVIEATGKTPKTYLDLRLRGGRLSGSTEMLFSNHPDMVYSGLYARRQTAISDGQVQGEHFSFTTKRQYNPDLGRTSTMKDLIHHYEGRIEGDKLYIEVQVEGGYHEAVTAERVPDERPAAELVATLEGHTGSVDQIVPLPDGRLASGSRDETVRIWNLSTLEAEASFAHGSQVVAVMPLDGEQIISAESAGKVRVWNIRTGIEQLTFEKIRGLINDVIPIENGRLAGSWSGGEITLWNIATGRIEKTLKLDEHDIVKMALLRDGRLATGDHDGTIRLWNLTSGQSEVLVRKGKPGEGQYVTGLKALKDGRLAYSTTDDKEVTIWNPATRMKDMTLPLKKRLWAELLAVFDDGHIAIEDSNGDVTACDPVTGKGQVVLNLDHEEWGLGTVTQLPDGRLAMGTGNGPIKLWKLR